jgi:neutral ceramidase
MNKTSTLKRAALAVLWLLAQLAAHVRAADAPKLSVGTAAIELHCTDDQIIAGSIGPQKAVGQDGLLRVLATVVRGGPDNARVAIVALDILMMERVYLDAAAREIEQRTGIPFSNILINCTHTHHAPSTVKIHGYDVLPEFVAQIQHKIVEAVVTANDRLAQNADVRMLFSMGQEATVGQNSRRELSDGTISWGIHDDEIRPTGPFDPDFPVLAFKRPDRSLAAVIFGHSTHTIGTRNPGRRSPGFYGLAAQTFEKDTGAVSTFLEGASGSTHLRRSIDGLAGSAAAIEAERRILNALRYSVDQAQPMTITRVGGIRREVAVKVRKFDEAKEEAAVEYYCRKRLGPRAEMTMAIFRAMRREYADHQGEERKTWLSAVRIGDVAIVAVPAEFFTQLGLDIKRRSPFRHTIIAELANDYVGYVGNADAYRLGGYQLWMGQHSWTERGTGEQFVDAAVELLQELHAR